jgi:HipA-like protein
MKIRKMRIFHKRNKGPKILVRYGSRSIGELWSEADVYHFAYLPDFFKLKLKPVPGLPEPEKDKVYKSAQLWPFFSVRIPDLTRKDVQDIVQSKGLDEKDRLGLLVVLGRETINNPFSLAPAR